MGGRAADTAAGHVTHGRRRRHAKRSGDSRSAGRAAPHADSGAAVRLTSLSGRKAHHVRPATQTARRRKGSLSSRPAAETRTENKERRKENILAARVRRKQEKKDTEISNENNDVSTPI
jgi:hypothetical protein